LRAGKLSSRRSRSSRLSELRRGHWTDAASSLFSGAAQCGAWSRRRGCGPEFAAKLALDKSVTSRRLREAVDKGYLVNLETRRGRPARIVLGDPMPETVKLLPEPSELAA
jgi:hypothetical protein